MRHVPGRRNQQVPLIIGHRGASASAPENTLAAFARAKKDRADGIEFDVRLAADGVPVCIHDASLRRTGLRPGRVSQLTHDELAAVDVGTWFNRRHPAHAREAFAREGIPTLARVLKLYGAKFDALYVELKCGRGEAERLARAVVEVISASSGHGRNCVVESFDLRALAEVRRLAPELATAALFERRLGRPHISAQEMIALARDCGASELALHRSLVTTPTVRAAREAGLPVVVWTADDPVWAINALELGLRAVITNHPARLSAELEDALYFEYIRTR